MKEYIDVLPTNVNQVQSVSYRNGNPLVEFKIGAQERYLLGSTIRINGQISVVKSGTTANPATGDKIAMDPRLGVYACLDQLVVSSAKTSQTIEHIKNYNTMLSTYLPVSSSPQDLVGHMGITGLSSANVGASLEQITTVTADVANPGAETGGSSFSIPLPCGFFLGQNPIPLSSSWGVQGINIQLFLAPDSAVLFSTDGSTSADGAYYVIRNLHLTAEVQNPAPDQLSQLMRQANHSYDYNSISGFYATIQSSYATINFQLGLKRVLSLWSSFIRSDHINNYAYNSFSRQDIRDGANHAAIKEVFFTRDSIRFPQEYIMTTMQHADGDITHGEDPQITRNFMNAVTPFSQLRRTTVSPYNTPGTSAADVGLPDGGNIFGIGVALDTISNQGVDYSNSQFGMVVNSSLAGISPQSVFVFVHAKQTLLMNPSGIQVLS